MKKCSICQIEKRSDEFPFRCKKTRILRHDCHSCNTKRKQRWADSNPEKVKKAFEKFTVENREIKTCKFCKKKFFFKEEERFCSKECNIQGKSRITESGCWEWKHALSKGGYGKSCFKGKEMNAHRVSYLIFNGNIPKNLWVLHKCDNRKCVNPDHLYLGDHAQNTRDRVERGRQSKPFFKKYSWTVAEKCFRMRKKGMTYDEIGQAMKINVSHARNLIIKYDNKDVEE